MDEYDRLKLARVNLTQKGYRMPVDYRKFDNQWGFVHFNMLY